MRPPLALLLVAALFAACGEPESSPPPAPPQSTAPRPQSAEEKLAREQRKAAALAELRKEFDEVERVTRWVDKAAPQSPDQNAIYVHFTEGPAPGRLSRLRLVMQYAGEPLGLRSYIVRADNQKFEDFFIVTSRQRTIDPFHPSDYWELSDNLMNDDDLRIVQAIIGSQSPILRLVGTSGKVDRKITEEEKQGLRHVLDAYEAMGGTLPYDMKTRA
jgi:hypothetical protein